MDSLTNSMPSSDEEQRDFIHENSGIHYSNEFRGGTLEPVSLKTAAEEDVDDSDEEVRREVEAPSSVNAISNHHSGFESFDHGNFMNYCSSTGRLFILLNYIHIKIYSLTKLTNKN